MQRNLDNTIWECKHKGADYQLTDEAKLDIYRMVTKGCSQNTKQRVARRLDLPLSCWERFGIYSRLILKDDGAEYICGQSWADEMRTLRECILK